MTFKLEHIVSGVISKAYPAARRDLWLHTAAGMNIQIIGVESLIFRLGGGDEGVFKRVRLYSVAPSNVAISKSLREKKIGRPIPI